MVDEIENVIIKFDEKDIEFDDDFGVDENILFMIFDDNNLSGDLGMDGLDNEEEGGSGGFVEGEVF